MAQRTPNRGIKKESSLNATEERIKQRNENFKNTINSNNINSLERFTKRKEEERKKARIERANANREKNNEENKKEEEGKIEPMRIMKTIKELTDTLKGFMDTTKKEIENLKKLIELNNKLTKKDKEEIKSIKIHTENRIQNIINEHKELKLKLEDTQRKTEVILTNTREISEQKSNNSEYKIYKEKIKQIQQNTIKQAKQKYTPIKKAILFDKFNPYKGRIITSKEKRINVYSISIKYKYNTVMYNIHFENKWQRLYKVINVLRKEGIVYGFRNMIESLRKRKHNNRKEVKNSAKESNEEMEIDHIQNKN